MQLLGIASTPGLLRGSASQASKAAPFWLAGISACWNIPANGNEGGILGLRKPLDYYQLTRWESWQYLHIQANSATKLRGNAQKEREWEIR